MSKFPPDVFAALVVCWRLTRAPAGKRLAPMLRTLVPMLRHDGEPALSDEHTALLLAMSAARSTGGSRQNHEGVLPREFGASQNGVPGF